MDFNVNLAPDITTFTLINPSNYAGLSNVNFWAFKRTFTVTSWAVMAFTWISIASALLVTMVKQGGEETVVDHLMDS